MTDEEAGTIFDEEEKYLQFLKNMIKFTAVFGGPFKKEDLEKELQELEEGVAVLV